MSVALPPSVLGVEWIYWKRLTLFCLQPPPPRIYPSPECTPSFPLSLRLSSLCAEGRGLPTEAGEKMWTLSQTRLQQKSKGLFHYIPLLFPGLLPGGSTNTPEAEFLDVIGKTSSEFSSLLFSVKSTDGFYPPSPKGIVSREFLLLVFFLNRLPPSLVIVEIFASQGAPPVSTTPVPNLPPIPLVLLIPAASLPPVATPPMANNRNTIRLLTP
jgi:hypothetical protein